MEFLTVENAKTIKGEALGYLTGIMYLAPANEARAAGHNVPNACPFASAGCKAACLFTAGRGAFNNVREARVNKSRKLFAGLKWNDKPHPEALESLRNDIAALERKALREGLKPAVRLNGTSDYPVETWGLMELFPATMFYDYTKDARRMHEFLAGKMPKNYHLTFSRSESNGKEIPAILSAGGLVAAVFAAGSMPRRYAGFQVLDGDESDLTFTRDKRRRGAILGLKAKGKARRDVSGFVVTI